jgi:tRNA(Ile)-lysidine synthase
MFKRISRYIQTHEMLPAGSRVLVGVSGGADSMALLHILNAFKDGLGITLAAAHMNHGIRAEADGDEHFVRDACAELGVPFIPGRADVPALARERSVSLEVAARQARHAFFRSAMEEGGFSILALAHHRGDQAETVLMRLVRGTGARGLGAMAPVEENGIIRPLLCAGREEIRQYCAENNIAWREDASNADTTIPRNWVRHTLPPLISERLNPAAEDALCRAAELLRQDEECLNAMAERALAGAQPRANGGVSVPVLDLAGLHPAVRSRALRLLIARAGLRADVEQCTVDAAAALLGGGMSGRRADLGAGFTALREGGTLSVVPAPPEEKK